MLPHCPFDAALHTPPLCLIPCFGCALRYIHPAGPHSPFCQSSDKRIFLALITVSMAKPSSLFASSSSSARRHRASPSSSSSSSTSPHPPLNRSLRCRRPGGTNTRTRTRTFALLAALSAAPLSAHAYPLDPPETSFPFLYPPFALEPTKALAKRSAAPSTSDAAAPTTTGAPPSPSSQCQYDRANLPDKYTLGDDGYWHKTPWSLYGSAYCNVSMSKPVYSWHVG